MQVRIVVIIYSLPRRLILQTDRGNMFCGIISLSCVCTFFLMMIFILLGGLYTPIDSMPVWAQWITKFNPVTYFIRVMRGVVLKGSGLRDIAPSIGIIFLFGVILNSWAVINYRKRG